MGAQPGKASNDPAGYIAWGKQAAKGTEAATFHFSKYLDGNGFDIEKDVAREREGGDGQEVGLTYVKMVKADGAMSANARGEYTARMFAANMGIDTVGTAAVPSLARHTTGLAASLSYFTVDQRWADEVERSVDNVFTGFVLEAEAGAPWKVSGNFICGGTAYQRDIASALTPTREQGKPFMFPFGSYTFDNGASYAADVTKIKVEVQRGVDDGIQTTGISRDDVVPLNFDASVDATIKYTSRDFYQKVIFNGGSSIISDLPTGSIDLVALRLVQVASGIFATGMMRCVMPLIEWTSGRVGKMDPDGKTLYLDLVGQTVKGATYPVYTVVDVGNATPFA